MTTGRVNRQARIPTQRREATRRLRERRRQNWVLALAAFVVLVIIAIPTVGFYLRFVVPPKQVIVSVNDVNKQLKDTVNSLRDRIERKEAQRLEELQNAEKIKRDEHIQLEEIINTLREKLEVQNGNEN